MRCIETILIVVALAIIAPAASAAEIQVTTTAKDGHYLFASPEPLTWTFRGPFVVSPDGKRLSGFASPGAMVVVARIVDGEIVQRIILPDGDDVPPPTGDKMLADKVRALSAGLPKAERLKVADIHADLAAKIDAGEITSSKKLFNPIRNGRMTEAFPGGYSNEWASFLRKLNNLLDAYDSDPDADDGPASDFAEAFKQIARGLK